MKTLTKLSLKGSLIAPYPVKSRHRGFALVVTLSLMILLTILAVGLLSLSSVSLRSSSQGASMAEARANARLALMMALGDLQKNAGSDQRITARGDINAPNAENPRLTGVWKSWKIDALAPPTADDYQFSTKSASGKFLGWLTSNPEPRKTLDVNFALEVPPTDSKLVATLWGANSLGSPNAPAKDIVKALKVQTPQNRGAFAWTVIDDGVKARINTGYSDNIATNSDKAGQLATGVRPGAEFLTGLAALDREFFEKNSTSAPVLAKGITSENYALAVKTAANDATKAALKPLFHDITTSSVGLFTDATRGGLKEDFNLLVDGGVLPSSYAGKGVYESVLGLSVNSVKSDPRWDSFFELGSLYKNKVRIVGGVPQISIEAPNDWASSKPTSSSPGMNLNPPPGLVLIPEIAKVQMIMTLIGRDLYGNLADRAYQAPLTTKEKEIGIHGPQDRFFRNTDYNYDLHLLYTPVVTMRNPYNVAIEFNKLRLEFSSVPFAVRIIRSGVAMSKLLIPMEHMTKDNENGQRSKPFALNLHTKTGGNNPQPGSDIFKMLPGEVVMFSPYIDPNLTWNNRGSYWDITLGTSKTQSMKAMPGWPGDGIGFDCDWLTGNDYQNQVVNGTYTNGRWDGCIGIKHDDKLVVEFSALAPKQSGNRFVVNMIGNVNNKAKILSTIELDYKSPDGLTDYFKANGEEMPMRFPKVSASPNFILGREIVDRANKPINQLSRFKNFAVLSFQAKSTSAGRTSSTLDGRLATKPMSFAHATIGASTQVIGVNQASASHEIDLQSLPGTLANFIKIDPQDRGYAVSGQTASSGVQFAMQYDVPLGPLKSLAKLNTANPGGSSGFLPRFAQPIGNSWAHPLMAADKINQPGTGANLLDHSFLLNLALYDKFYFSGFARQSGSAPPTAADLAKDFAEGNSKLSDTRLVINVPQGKVASQLADVVRTNPDAYKNIAAWQMMEGAFNVNSTSVSAWKAHLASIHDQSAIFNSLNLDNKTTSLSALPVDEGMARISRFSLPGSPSIVKGVDPKKAYWLGPREYSGAQLDLLAKEIVNQVRNRGPFLSMAEFVNRQIGPASSPKVQKGALQQAIDASGLNQADAAGSGGFDIKPALVASYGYGNAEAGTGDSAQGAPGFLTQADILNVLGNAATVRSDTFTIRALGEARSATGQVTASAVCEAVVQRSLSWVDSLDSPEQPETELLSLANKSFGRRFVIVSFRWLNTNEI